VLVLKPRYLSGCPGRSFSRRRYGRRTEVCDVVTAGETFQADIGIAGSKISQLGHGLGPPAKEIDAGGKYLLPGGVDVHTRVEA
jgi:adenine deaminase